MYNDLEELYIEGTPPKKVREIDTLAGEKIPGPTARRLQSLSSFYETFYKKIEEGNFSTRSSRYRVVSAGIGRLNLDRFNRVVFAGFFALTKSEKEIFKSLMKRENTLLFSMKERGLNRSYLTLESRLIREPLRLSRKSITIKVQIPTGRSWV